MVNSAPFDDVWLYVKPIDNRRYVRSRPFSWRDGLLSAYWKTRYRTYAAGFCAAYLYAVINAAVLRRTSDSLAWEVAALSAAVPVIVLIRNCAAARRRPLLIPARVYGAAPGSRRPKLVHLAPAQDRDPLSEDALDVPAYLRSRGA